MTLMVNQLCGFGVVRSVATATFVTSAVSTADTTTYTFAATSLGTASPGRYIIVTIGGTPYNTGTTITSVTVGGISATQVAYATTGGAIPSNAGMFIAAVPTGTTGDVVVTFSDTMYRAGIGVYATTTILTPSPSATSSSTATTPTTTINVQAGGFVIACAATYLAGSAPTYTWTGPTENYDAAMEGGGSSHTGAYLASSTHQSSLTVTATPSGATTSAMVVASFQ